MLHPALGGARLCARLRWPYSFSLVLVFLLSFSAPLAHPPGNPQWRTGTANLCPSEVLATPLSVLDKGGEPQELLDKLRSLTLEAAARHNSLEGVSDDDFATWMMAILITERGGLTNLQNPLYSKVGYALWQEAKVTKNRLGGNSSIGIAQIRPETVTQLRQGWVEHRGLRVYHGVQLAIPPCGAVPYGLSLALLARDDVSIELLAANLEMGAAVSRAFGKKPTLEDLARWHNTGMGSWDLPLRPGEERLWDKAESYVRKVRRNLVYLTLYPDLAILPRFTPPLDSPA